MNQNPPLIKYPYLSHTRCRRTEETATFLESEPAIIIGDFNATEQSAAGRGGDHFRRIIQSGWKKETPAGTSYFGNKGRMSAIDHALYNEHCFIENSQYITQIGNYCLAGNAAAISDHAMLLASLRK